MRSLRASWAVSGWYALTTALSGIVKNSSWAATTAGFDADHCPTELRAAGSGDSQYPNASEQTATAAITRLRVWNGRRETPYAVPNIKLGTTTNE